MKHKVLIDLFCGTGGFSHGWIQGGGGIAVSVDNWEDALKNHAHNHPEVPVLNLSLGGDIEETEEETTEEVEEPLVDEIPEV